MVMRGRKPSTGAQPAQPTRRQARLGVALATAIAVLLVVWLLIEDDDSAESPSSVTGGPRIVSVDEMRDVAAAGAAPIYWAGAPAGSQLELSRPEASRSYVRYLVGDAEAGDPRPFLTVGSYGIKDAAAILRRQGNRPGGVSATAPEHGAVYFERESPTSVYLAYPGEDVEIEVYAPSFQQALGLVTSGRIVPVE
jgi:hypothetical protein